ncbi:MAG: CheY-like chemotaxis protein, partial [Planctomycetota bacterium]
MRIRARILLVDDNEVDFVFTRRMLSRLSTGDPMSSHYMVEWSPGVDEALVALESERHDVCLVDYQLGDRNGLDLLREARRRGMRVPMILLTGRGDPDVDAQAMALGAAGYLDKETIDPEQLDRALR